MDNYTNVELPPVGGRITEVEITHWLKSEGEHVTEGDTLCEFESNKMSFELKAETSGVLRILVEKGTKHKIGTVVCQIQKE